MSIIYGPDGSPISSRKILYDVNGKPIWPATKITNGLDLRGRLKLIAGDLGGWTVWCAPEGKAFLVYYRDTLMKSFMSTPSHPDPEIAAAHFVEANYRSDGEPGLLDKFEGDSRAWEKEGKIW